MRLDHGNHAALQFILMQSCVGGAESRRQRTIALRNVFKTCIVILLITRLLHLNAVPVRLLLGGPPFGKTYK